MFKRFAEVPYDDTSIPVFPCRGGCVDSHAAPRVDLTGSDGGTTLHSLPCGARRLLEVVVSLRSLRGYGVDPGIHYQPATDLAGGC